MQADGNLVLYNKNGKALWASGTAGSVGDRLEVQSDGNLVVCVPPPSPTAIAHINHTQRVTLTQVPRQRSQVGVSLQ
jgi:hypothetical protein